MNRSPKIALLSIKPEFSNAIFAASKTIELRKTKINISCGDILIIYESSPTMALVGKLEVHEVLSDRPEILWKKVSRKVGIDKFEYDAYFQDKSVAYGIVVKSPKTFRKPISLSSMREIAKLNPPQSFRYLSFEQLKKLGISLR